MADLTQSHLDDVLAVCRSGAEEAAAAIGRALDHEVGLVVGEAVTLDAPPVAAALAGPGLAVVFMLGETGALVALSDSSGLVPAWCADPDPTGRSKLTTLAQELGMVLLPEAFMPDDFAAGHIDSLAQGLDRGQVTPDAAVVPLEIRRADGQGGSAYLIWPLGQPRQVLTPLPASQPSSPSPPTSASLPPPVAPPALAEQPAPSAPGRRSLSLDDLPIYSRSLLRIPVTVVVTLAEKRQPLGRILELGPGSIIQFDKSCDEALELEAGGRTVALGEAVKVGEKFGLRITSMIMPEERFVEVRK